MVDCPCRRRIHGQYAGGGYRASKVNQVVYTLLNSCTSQDLEMLDDLEPKLVGRHPAHMLHSSRSW